MSRHPGMQGNSAGHLSCVLTALLSNAQGDLDPLQLFEDGPWETFTLRASKRRTLPSERRPVRSVGSRLPALTVGHAGKRISKPLKPFTFTSRGRAQHIQCIIAFIFHRLLSSRHKMTSIVIHSEFLGQLACVVQAQCNLPLAQQERHSR